MNTNLKGPYNLIRSVLPAMLARQYGNIVNVASVHGHKIIPGAFPYPVAKHGLIGLTRSRRGVRRAGHPRKQYFARFDHDASR